MRYYSPVGRGVSLLKAQGSISYVQSDEETYDMKAEENGHICPDIGDLIEFWSDKYTDKGPATGTISNTANGVMCVKFGDEYQWLSTRVDVRKVGLNHKGKTLWQIE